MAQITIEQFTEVLSSGLDFLFNRKLAEVYFPLLMNHNVIQIVEEQLNLDLNSVLTLGSIKTSALVNVLLDSRYIRLSTSTVLKQQFENCICITILNPFLYDTYQNTEPFNIVLPIIEYDRKVNIRNIIVECLNSEIGYNLVS